MNSASQPCRVSPVVPALSGYDDDDGDDRSETTSGHKASEVAGPPNGTLTLTTRYPGHSKDTLLIECLSVVPGASATWFFSALCVFPPFVLKYSYEHLLKQGGL